MRLDKALHLWGLVPSRSKAQELLRAGHIERFRDGAWQVLDDPSLEVDEIKDQGNYRLKDDTLLKYVSRGGLKLEAALEHLHLEVRGLRALDVGLSTGGFADCLLQRGLESLVGVDVGSGQLAEKLKADPRIKSFEGINARELSRHPLMESYKANPFDLIVVDVSFISLSLVLPELIPFLKQPNGRILALVKPQFELGPADLNSAGVVFSPEVHQRALARVEAAAHASGFALTKIIPSAILGGDGNQEFFMLLKARSR